MARSFVSALNKIAKEAAKQQRQMERQRQSALREQERQERYLRQQELQHQREIIKLNKEYVRQTQALERERKAAYIEERKQEAIDLNNEVEYRLYEYSNVLTHTLEVNDTISFDSLKKNEIFPQYQEPTLENLFPVSEPNRTAFFAHINTEQGFLEKLFGHGKKKRELALQEAEHAFQKAINTYNNTLQLNSEITERNNTVILNSRSTYEKNKEEFLKAQNEHNQLIDDFHNRYLLCDQEAVETYVSMVLESSDYSDIFPQTFDLSFNSENKELIVNYELPDIAALPHQKNYKYIQSRDEIVSTSFKSKEIKDIYTNIICCVALRTIHEIFESDQNENITSVVLNGYVNSVDLSTGQNISPCIITIQTSKEQFSTIDLSRVDVIACVKGLKAQLSPAPSELSPVKPIAELNMHDSRFIEEKHFLESLDNRTNLLEMNPFDFEHLVCNLFNKIGLQASTTRASRDGGIDVIAFDPRPVFGGKYVIQVKRYKNTVDVAAVRDLYGAMTNENASKGILVTTSSYGHEARSFAKDKPIELIDGSNLLFMLQEQGISAKIEAPS